MKIIFIFFILCVGVTVGDHPEEYQFERHINSAVTRWIYRLENPRELQDMFGGGSYRLCNGKELSVEEILLKHFQPATDMFYIKIYKYQKISDTVQMFYMRMDDFEPEPAEYFNVWYKPAENQIIRLDEDNCFGEGIDIENDTDDKDYEDSD